MNSHNCQLSTVNCQFTEVAIIGAGAAGFFTAINIMEACPSAHVTIYEGGKKALAKVAVTGGGRCNLTNTFDDIRSTASVYPRGEKLMKRALRVFSHQDAMDWFEAHGIELCAQADNCIFPRSQDAMQIVNMLTVTARKLGISVKLSHRVELIKRIDSAEDTTYRISFLEKNAADATAHAVVVTTGGSPHGHDIANMLSPLPIELIAPVPSLFSFKLAERKALSDLMGTVVSNAAISIQGTRFKAAGTLLITHWGMSGPAILRLSSYAARLLNSLDYRATLIVNWTGENGENDVRENIQQIKSVNGGKQMASIRPFGFTARLWLFILQRAGIASDKRWAELGLKGINKLVNTLTCDEYHIDGENKYKEEFVTCGGVSLSCINPTTLEARQSPLLYFAGEVLDVDAVTGGFNLQAAWSMGYIVAQELTKKMSNYSRTPQPSMR